MTTPRDPDRLLAAYLADGMEILSDRVTDAVLDEVHRTRQRAVFGPRRTFQMLKPFLAASAAIVAVAVGAYALGLLKPASSDPGSSATPPVATQSDAVLPTAQPSFVSLQRGELEAGVWQARLAEQVVSMEVPADQGRVFGTVWPDAKTVLIENVQGDFTIQSGRGAPIATGAIRPPTSSSCPTRLTRSPHGCTRWTRSMSPTAPTSLWRGAWPSRST